MIHIPTDVAVWTSLLNLFDASISQHKRIDHVFVAAGVRGFKADYLGESFDPSTGALQEPPSHTFDINLRAAINTAYLGLYHMRHQSPAKGSIVVTGSASAFLRFRNTDYTVAKHGILGFMRGLVPALAEHHSHIRINCVSPSWTRTGMLHSSTFDDVGYGDQMQDPEVVAKSAVLLMADEKRHGQNIYSRQGKFWEVESVFLKAARDIVGEVDEDVVSIVSRFPKRTSMVLVANSCMSDSESRYEASGRGKGSRGCQEGPGRGGRDPQGVDRISNAEISLNQD